LLRKGYDQQIDELSRYKLGQHTTDDADGYHRVTVPACLAVTARDLATGWLP
jgi:hypothetical protein